MDGTEMKDGMEIPGLGKASVDVPGKQIKVEWIDTKSDKPTAASNANELISKGAVAIVATCDFDFSFPAINAARAKKVPGTVPAPRRSVGPPGTISRPRPDCP